MLSHELARQLLNLPNLEVCDYDDGQQIIVGNVPDTSHKDYIDWNTYCERYNADTRCNIEWDNWSKTQPQVPVIYIPIQNA